ncbi:MAG: GNAT family N-acetyltransferase [Chloroflexota bacterium]|nr:GNAT family N-acetyltransferase [Chloroflexota bacterium]
MPDRITIEDLALPASLDEPGAAAYVEFIELRNTIDAEALGSTVEDLDPVEALPYFQDQTYDRRRLFTARLDGRIVGLAMMSWAVDASTNVTWLGGGVHPASRNRGVGSALLDHVESIARESRRAIVQSGAIHTSVQGGEQLESPTGFGSVAREDPGVRFFLAHGYTLEQVHRISFLHLPIAPEVLAAHREQATAAAGSDYRVHAWTGPTPEHWLDDIALLNQRMSTDAPFAGLEIDEEPWDAERVRSHEARSAKVGRTRLIAAVEHVPSEHLVAFNGLSIPQDRTRPVQQGPTLVLTEHRGHRLGMAVKVVNLQQVARVSPESTTVSTGNAEENRHMLNVNEALGFVPAGYVGAWKKTL